MKRLRFKKSSSYIFKKEYYAKPREKQMTDYKSEFEKETGNSFQEVELQGGEKGYIKKPHNYFELYIKYIESRLSKVEQENKQLKEGLKFYADNGNYCKIFIQDNHPEKGQIDERCPVLQDDGKIASNLLNKTKNKGKE